MNQRRIEIDLSPRGRGLRWYLALGAVIGGYGCYRMSLTTSLVADGRPAPALVTYMDHLLRSPDEAVDPWHNEIRWSGRAYRTVVFTADSGQRVADQSRWSWNNYSRKGFLRHNAVPQDTTAAILYDPSDPTCWLFDDPTSLWTIPGVCMFLGAGLLLYAAAVQQGWVTPPRIRFVTKARVARPEESVAQSG